MRYTEALRWGIIGALGLLLFIPFIIADGKLFPGMFFPFITGKNFAFRIIVELLLGAYILLALREPKYRPRGSHLLWAVCGFVVWVGLATVFSVDPVKSFWSNFERMEGYVSLIHMFALFIVAGAVLTAEKWWDTFFKVSIFAATLQGFYALFQVLGWISISTQSGVRVDTSFGNAIYLAAYLLFNIFLTLYILGKEKHSRGTQALYGVSLVLQAVALFNTETRGAILGLLGGLVIWALFILWKGRGSNLAFLRTWLIGGLVGLVILVAGFILIKDSAFVKSSSALSRLASISLEDKTTKSRFMIWNMAYNGFLEKPVLGWGQENFSYVFNKYYNPQMYDQEQWFDRAHNGYLDWLIAAGLPAFVLFLSFFGLGAWIVYRSDLAVTAQAALIGLLAGYGFHSLLVFDNLISAMYLFLLLAFLHGLTERKVPRFLFLSRAVGDRGVAIAAPVVLVATIVCIWTLNVPGMSRAQSILDSITTQKAVLQNGAVATVPRDPKENLASFEKTLALGRLGQQETVEQLFTFTSSLASNNNVSPETKQAAYDLALSEGEKFIASRPGDARMELFLASFFNQYGKNAEALQHYLKALELSPGKQQILLQLGLTKLALGDTKGAVEAFKTAYDEAPSFSDARIYYAIGLYYNNERATADKLLTEGFGTTLVDDQKLLNLYTSLGMYDRVIGLWQMKVDANPTDAQTRVNLAAAYFASGNVQKTVEVLREAAKVEPGIAGQVETLITQIQNGTLKPGQ